MHCEALLCQDHTCINEDHLVNNIINNRLNVVSCANVLWLAKKQCHCGFLKIAFGIVSLTFYTPEMKLRTYYGMASVRPSICPSVRPLATSCPPAQYLEKFRSDSHGTW